MHLLSAAALRAMLATRAPSSVRGRTLSARFSHLSRLHSLPLSAQQPPAELLSWKAPVDGFPGPSDTVEAVLPRLLPDGRTILPWALRFCRAHWLPGCSGVLLPKQVLQICVTARRRAEMRDHSREVRLAASKGEPKGSVEARCAPRFAGGCAKRHAGHQVFQPSGRFY